MNNMNNIICDRCAIKITKENYGPMLKDEIWEGMVTDKKISLCRECMVKVLNRPFKICDFKRFMDQYALGINFKEIIAMGEVAFTVTGGVEHLETTGYKIKAESSTFEINVICDTSEVRQTARDKFHQWLCHQTIEPKDRILYVICIAEEWYVKAEDLATKKIEEAKVFQTRQEAIQYSPTDGVVKEYDPYILVDEDGDYLDTNNNWISQKFKARRFSRDAVAPTGGGLVKYSEEKKDG